MIFRHLKKLGVYTDQDVELVSAQTLMEQKKAAKEAQAKETAKIPAAKSAPVKKVNPNRKPSSKRSSAKKIKK